MICPVQAPLPLWGFAPHLFHSTQSIFSLQLFTPSFKSTSLFNSNGTTKILPRTLCLGCFPSIRYLRGSEIIVPIICCCPQGDPLLWISEIFLYQEHYRSLSDGIQAWKGIQQSVANALSYSSLYCHSWTNSDGLVLFPQRASPVLKDRVAAFKSMVTWLRVQNTVTLWWCIQDLYSLQLQKAVIQIITEL